MSGALVTSRTGNKEFRYPVPWPRRTVALWLVFWVLMSIKILLSPDTQNVIAALCNLTSAVAKEALYPVRTS
eukprot:scaffold116369_cov15-Tisochrysis_lutea.AAC.1